LATAPLFSKLLRLLLGDVELLPIRVGDAVVLHRVADHLERDLLRRHHGMIRVAALVRSVPNAA
jgi:hypothetical protein